MIITVYLSTKECHAWAINPGIVGSCSHAFKVVLSFRGVNSSTGQLPVIYIDIVPLHSLFHSNQWIYENMKSTKKWASSYSTFKHYTTHIHLPPKISNSRSIMVCFFIIFLKMTIQIWAENPAVSAGFSNLKLPSHAFLRLKATKDSLPYLLAPPTC